MPAQASGPGECVEDRKLGAVLDAARERDGLLRPRVGHRDALDPDRRDVRSKLTEDGGAQARVVRALGQRPVEEVEDLPIARHVAAREEEPRSRAWRPRRERVDDRHQEVAEPLLLPRDLEVRPELQQPVARARDGRSA